MLPEVHQTLLKNWLAVVPARLKSRRLSNKPLQLLGGKELIVQVYENILPITKLGARVVVATDAQEIFDLCKNQHVPVEMTSSDHPSGSDRCHEVASRHERRFILNVQGDDPFVHCVDLVELCCQIEANPLLEMGTLVYESKSERDYFDPQIVKVVERMDNCALYFSRRSLPFTSVGKVPQYFLKHIGVYAYRQDVLARFCQQKPSFLEGHERLEQLRALEHGIVIYLQRATHDSHGIDTPEDLARAERLLARAHAGGGK